MDSRLWIVVPYFAAFAIYQVLGVWSAYIDFRSKQNRLLTAMSSGLAIWAFSIAIMLYVDSREQAVVMARIAGFGFAWLGALFLHFTLVNIDSQILKGKRWLLYVPPLFAYVIIYMISDNIVIERSAGYTLRWFGSGFSQTLPEHLNNLYSLFCLGAATWVMYVYLRGDIHPKMRAQIRNLFIGTAIGFVLLFATMFIRAFVADFVQPAILISSFAITASLIHNSYKYKFLSRRIPLRHHVDDIKEEADNHSVHISNVFLIYCNAMYLLMFFFGNGIENWHKMVPSVISAFLMYHISLADLPSRRKDIYLAVVVSINILISFVLSTDLSVLTISTFGFSILIFAIISDSLLVKGLLIAAALLGTIFLSHSMVGLEFVIGKDDYFFRIVFAVMTLYALEFVGRKIRHDDSRNFDHLKFQEILTSFSIKSVESHIDNIGDLIDDIAKVVAEYFGIEDSYILTRHGSVFSNGNFSIPVDLVEDMKEGEYIYVNDIYRLSLAEEDLVRDLFGEKTASLFIVPIVRNDRVDAVYCDFSEQKRREVLNDIIRTISNTIKNILEKRDKENTIFSYAYFDTSSGLPNRNMFTRKLETAIESVQNNQTRCIAVVFIGFEHSKRISGANTKEIPEQHLGVIGNRLAKENSFVARFGNDNLILLVENYEDLQAEIEGIHSVFDTPVAAGDSAMELSVVTGVSVYPNGGNTARTLVKNADLALYEARRGGDQRTVYYSEELESKLQERLSLTNSLYRALENEELLLMYQPQVDAISGMIVGAEALIRWNHPEKGMISPGIFIPLAEETGIISLIGRWVLEEACTQAKKWQLAFGKEFLIAVNVSTKQLHDGALAKTVENVLKKTGLSPASLEIEVTESEQMTRGANQAIYNLQRLRELGVKIAIDDFGTRYSSLSRLRYMPITKLKIDMGFVRAIEGGERYQNLVRSIISLGKNLGLNVLAEGVETEFQYKFLRDNGCDKIQGYYFFKPLEQEEIERIFRMGVD